MSATTRHAPGSLRATKTANLESRTEDASSRRSDQHRVWDEVDRQSVVHSIASDTSALEDIQREAEEGMADQLEQIEPLPDQIGVVCMIGDRVAGLDLFDKPATLAKYLRGIVAGHALDAPSSTWNSDSIRVIERFLGQIDSAGQDTGRGVGLGEEILLHGNVTGIGLTYEEHLIHLAAFMAPA